MEVIMDNRNRIAHCFDEGGTYWEVFYKDDVVRLKVGSDGFEFHSDVPNQLIQQLVRIKALRKGE